MALLSTAEIVGEALDFAQEKQTEATNILNSTTAPWLNQWNMDLG
jgi:hypothetical protein